MCHRCARFGDFFRTTARTALVVTGVVLVVTSAAFSSTVPWFLRRALDGIRAGAPLRSIWLLGAAMVGVSLVGGVGRFWMRELLNGMSRWIEYDLRNDSIQKSRSGSTPHTTPAMRTGDLMARLTNDLSAVRMAVGPAIMYLTNTIAGGAFALGVHAAHLAATHAASPRCRWRCCPLLGHAHRAAIHARFEAVQAHFSDLTTLAQENLAGVRIVRAFRQERAEIARFAALNEGYLEKNMALARLYGVMQPGFAIFAGLGMVGVVGFGGRLVVRGHDHRRRASSRSACTSACSPGRSSRSAGSSISFSAARRR